MPGTKTDVADALRDLLMSPNESDSNWEPANLVDAIFFAGRAIGTGLESVAKQLGRLADAQERAEARERAADELALVREDEARTDDDD